MVPWINFAHPKQRSREEGPFFEKQSITPGQPGGGAKTAPLEIVITLDPTVLPDKKNLLPYKKVDKQTWGRGMILLRAEDLVGRLS